VADERPRPAAMAKAFSFDLIKTLRPRRHITPSVEEKEVPQKDYLDVSLNRELGIRPKQN
jgi:hypothetical protein